MFDETVVVTSQDIQQLASPPILQKPVYTNLKKLYFCNKSYNYYRLNVLSSIQFRRKHHQEEL